MSTQPTSASSSSKISSFSPSSSSNKDSCHSVRVFPLSGLKKKIHTRNQLPSIKTMKNVSRRIKLEPHLVLLLFVATLIVKQTAAEVITLTPDTFSDKVNEKHTAWFVKFCVPWCKHCKNLGSLWEDFGKVMEGEDDVEVGEVDCGLSKPVCTKVDIHSYPTFKIFYNGEEVAKYQGPRDVESLKNFVLEEAEKAARKEQLDGEDELLLGKNDRDEL